MNHVGRVVVIAIGVLAVGVAPAVADSSDARKAADQLAAEARAAHDNVKYVACGQAYLDLYNKDPQAGDIDEVLDGAAGCFQLGKSISAQLAAHGLLLRNAPRSPLAKKALLATANAYAAIAYYDRAADRFEEYASKFAGERDAVDALASAIRYRGAIGDTAKQLADSKRFLATYGSKQPRAAADVMYAMVSVSEPPQAIELLRQYMKTYGSTLDPDQVVIAHARLADLLWAQSCPVATLDGLCITVVRERPVQRCGPDRIPRLAIVKRNTAGVEALDEYKQTVALFEHAPSQRAAHAAAMAKLALADAELEHMLEARFPTDLDFDPGHRAARERSMKTFEKWVADEQAFGVKVSAHYEATLQLKDAEASVAAAARLGQTVEVFWRELMLAEIPKSYRSGDFAKDKRAAYCDALRAVADPLQARAVEVFHVCHQKSLELAAGASWARACEREAHLLAPETFPDANELIGSVMVAMPLALEPAL